MSVPVSSGCEQLVVEVAANERHKCPACGMDPADRQLSGQVGNLWVIARQNFQLQLGRSLDSEVGVLLSEPCPLRLAAVVNAEQHQWRGLTHGQGILRLRNHDDKLLESKGTRHGSLGFHKLRLTGSGLISGRADLARNNGHSSSHDELHNYIITTHSCCQESIKSLILRDFLSLMSQRYAITTAKQLTVPVIARAASSMRLPLQMSRPFSPQYRQTALCTTAERLGWS